MENLQHLNNMKELKYICVDFDGTCVTHDYPRVGEDIGAAPVLRKLTDKGYKLILFTMRSEKGVREGKFSSGLTDAVKWFSDNQIPLFGVQTNPTQKFWTESPKAYGQIYLDDAALGAPLKFDPKISDRPFYDWEKAEQMLKDMGVLPSNIDPNVIVSIINGVTEEMMNGEEVYKMEETIIEDGIIIDFNIDTPYSDDGGIIRINTTQKVLECRFPESHEGCGMEEKVEEKLKNHLGY
jgi:hypothetical protein